MAHNDQLAGSLSERAKAAQKAYLKEWRAKNPDKIRAYNMNYWKRKILKDLGADPDLANCDNCDPKKEKGG